jgi:hypothetical protein
MCACVRLFCVCVGMYLGRGLAAGRSLVQGVQFTYTRTFCQKNKGPVKVEQGPNKIDSGTIYRTPSSNGTPLQIGIDE